MMENNNLITTQLWQNAISQLFLFSSSNTYKLSLSLSLFHKCSHPLFPPSNMAKRQNLLLERWLNQRVSYKHNIYLSHTHTYKLKHTLTTLFIDMIIVFLLFFPFTSRWTHTCHLDRLSISHILTQMNERSQRNR